MNKNQWLKIVNTVIFCVFIVLALTGLSLFFNLFSFHEEIIANLHEYAGLAFIALVIVHLTLNWGWIKANFRLRK